MVLICCLDDNKGMMFNKRRQSRDIEVTKRIIELTKGKQLYIDEYSKKLFQQAGFNSFEVLNSQDLPESENTCLFLENIPPSSFENKALEIILFKWNRVYPADSYFDICLDFPWQLKSTKDFCGKSHEKITMEVYRR